MAAGTSGEATAAADCTLVYLVRHGQTPLNESGVLRSLLDPPLDEAGHLQAGRLGAVLGPRRPSVVIASPLLRARQTAQPVADRAGCEVATDRRLLDRDYGQWTGTDRESVVAQSGSVDDAPGVEPVRAVRERAVRGLTGIARVLPRRHGGGGQPRRGEPPTAGRVRCRAGGSRHAPAKQRVLQHSRAAR